MTSFDEVKPQPLSQTVLDKLREAIIAGTLKPGESLVQSRLAVQFGVSRAPLREAMNRLEEEGFARSVPYKGSTVAPLTTKDFEEIRELRNMLERWAGSLIIARGLSSDLREIKLAYATMSDAATRKDTEAVDEADLAFHTLICRLSGNSLLLEVWNRYANRFRWVLTYCNRVNEDLNYIVSKHEPLLQAFRTRDNEGLRRFYMNHPTDLTPFLPEELKSTT